MFKWYNCTDDKKTLHKKPVLLETDEESIIFGDSSILSPTIKCKTYSGNYVYISQFNRYYFITNVIWSKGYYYVSCAVDTLYSNENAINNMSVLVTRSENRTTDIPDSNIPFRANKYVKTRTFDNAVDVISSSTTHYLIGVI